MKKKIVSLLLCFTMIFSFGLTACENAGVTSPCTHEYTEETFLEASCISEGIVKKTCKKCEKETYEKTEKLSHEYEEGICVNCKTEDPSWGKNTTCEHEYEEETFVGATCISEGVLKKTCSKCEEVAYEKTEKLSHSYADGACTVCGKANPNAVPCTHNYAQETFLKATCISEGVLKKTCSKCRETVYEKTQKMQHEYVQGVCDFCKTADPSWRDTITFVPDDGNLDLGDCKHLAVTTIVQEPTCHEFGMKLEVCLACAKVSVIEGYAATGEHTWVEKIEAPTCISDGVKYRQCEICGAQQFIELLKKLGHDRQNGACTRCEGGNNGGSVAQNNTINVQVFKGSYGVDWVYAVAEKFEEAYVDEGYRVNVTPSTDIRNNVAIQELTRGYEQTQVDMYITGGVSSNKVGREGAHGVLAEEISDLWDAKPIGFNGQEESKTLRQKVTAGTVDAFKDNYGETYGIPYIAMTGGLVVNTRKLALYGINTLPTTTNELFDMWTTIYCGANGMENSEWSGLFPFTFYNNSANGYPIDWWTTAMAQYDERLSKEYWSWQTENGDGSVTWWENGVEEAINDAFKASAEVMAQAFDLNVAAYNTTTQTLDQAQAQIMKQNGGAIFMCNGSWYLNDMKLNYANSLEDITFINFPVVSSLATKLWGTQGKSEADLEAALRAAIAYVDDVTKAADLATGATTVTAATGVTVTAGDMAEVRRARYAYSDRTADSQMVITKGTPKADICELFMRMIASNDAAQLISQHASGNSAYMTTANTYSQYTFVKDASKIHTNAYATAHSNQAKGYRFAMEKTNNSFTVPNIPIYFAGLANAESIYDGYGYMSGRSVQVYKDSAATLVARETEMLSDLFDAWKTENANRIATYKQIWGYNG